jgi:hypothetical protein
MMAHATHSAFEAYSAAYSVLGQKTVPRLKSVYDTLYATRASLLQLCRAAKDLLHPQRCVWCIAETLMG